MFPNLGLTWEDTAWLRAFTRLPLVAKGVLSGEDARRAIDAGFDGVIVANHGGRQVDGAIAALDAVGPVRATVGPDFPVLMDSGVRRGSDILKALALGANCVLIGRPYMWGLAAGGQAGGEEVIHSIAAETDLAMALLGAHGGSGLDPGFIAESV